MKKMLMLLTLLLAFGIVEAVAPVSVRSLFCDNLKIGLSNLKTDDMTKTGADFRNQLASLPTVASGYPFDMACGYLVDNLYDVSGAEKVAEKAKFVKNRITCPGYICTQFAVDLADAIGSKVPALKTPLDTLINFGDKTYAKFPLLLNACAMVVGDKLSNVKIGGNPFFDKTKADPLQCLVDIAPNVAKAHGIEKGEQLTEEEEAELDNLF